ncbi:3-oxoacid CoA-transferase subunit B [Tardiphaga robiniae]|uniref:3-oxoadipate CoA-transferase n=1 Tax=Tardiphaga robiniae TaxID=943830 RepID=A0A163XF81_9BRAD|nr:3-oxoacid CoA-transferase subunit B [Tardiphaga robiniae]KZD20837.1 3-oxoadipate CoA-transferase [Tardiphaga robiniae]
MTSSDKTATYKPLNRDQMAWRAAQDLQEGAYVNLGIGMPTRAASYVPDGREVIFHSENGILGLGPKPEPGTEDENLIDAGKNYTTLIKGGVFMHHADAFLMIRGKHLDVSLLGAFEVSEAGDLANWTTEDPSFPPGVGGAMDLAVGAKEIRVIMDHTDKGGKPRILKTCRLPLTAPGCVKRIYTNLAVIDVTEQGLFVREMVEGMTLEQLQALTEPKLQLANNWQSLTPPAMAA